MKFLIDAQLPASLKQVFLAHGYDCIHTTDLDLKNQTSDRDINSLSLAENRIVITKDADFLESFLLKKGPWKLILVKLGNTSKNDLIRFFVDHLLEIIEKIANEDMVVLKK
jgi:predicted nuclease of predicted toxin-antitoxin system